MNTAVKNEVMLPEVVGQLIKFAKAENMNKESDDIAKFGEYVTDLQKQIAALEKQIEVMSKTVESLQSKDAKEVHNTMLNESKAKISSLKGFVGKCGGTLKPLLLTFKIKGSNAFKVALQACKLDTLAKEGAKLNHSAAQTFKESAERTALFAKQMSDVRHSVTNAVRVLADEEVLSAPRHLENDKGLLHSIENGFAGLSQRFDKLGALADNLSDKIGYRYVKVTEKQKDILSSEGYNDFAKADETGKFICKYPAEEKNNIMQLINAQSNNMKM